ncbi:uncharacterized protein Pyn_17727 [Prunus yedoensis var. nudiflora]|uniref:Uncharacterized protein n=1 Tax=Prunus yedoensis var. nudiflora TaxID=2094558 RepID=A0A314YDS1_PRUYE|nr:uncharacterized protein Pyn_17727 [Prunus yedoensis var. nudiflora]
MATVQMVAEEVGVAETVVEEEIMAEEPVEETIATEMVVEEGAVVETVIEEAAADEVVIEEVAEGTADEGAEEAVEEAIEKAAEEATEGAAEETTEEAAEEATADVPVEPLPSAPRRPSGIVFRSPPQSSPPLAMVETTLPLAPLSQDSIVVAEPVVMEPRSREATSSDDLEELYASLHEEGGSSASAPLDEDSKTVIERLREFLLLGVHQITAAGALMEFRSCLDTAMVIGLLDLAQLDELQARLAEDEGMIGRYAEAVMRMVEGSSLEQDLVEIKEKVQPTMARLKENDLVVQRENEELVQVEAQIAELQARRDLILQRRDGAVATGHELRSSAKQILKAATETKEALAERKLIRARWQADIDGEDIAWRRITCLIWGMFSEGV